MHCNNNYYAYCTNNNYYAHCENNNYYYACCTNNNYYAYCNDNYYAFCSNNIYYAYYTNINYYAYFNTNNWQLNQPIFLRDLYILLDKIKGVQSVKNISIITKIFLCVDTPLNIVIPILEPIKVKITSFVPVTVHVQLAMVQLYRFR